MLNKIKSFLIKDPVKVVVLLFLLVFVLAGTFYLSKVLTYQQVIEKTFLNSTRQKLKKAVSTPKIDEIINEGGSRFKKLLSSLNIAENSFAFTINGEGKIKLPDNLSEYNDESEVASRTMASELETFVKLASENKSACFELYSETSQEYFYCFIEDIPNSNWSLAVAVLKDSIVMRTMKERVNLFLGILFLILAFALIASYLGYYFPKTLEKKIWYSTSLFSISLAIGICLICVNSNLRKDYEYPDEIALTNSNIIKGYLDQYDQYFIDSNKKPIGRVKVGIYIKDIEVVSSTKVNFSGFVWQKLSKNQIGKIKEGFLFSDACATEITEVYVKDTPDGGQIYGWYFTTTTKAELKGELYPFDVEAIWLRLTSVDFSDKVIFVPATEDYDNIEPVIKPGIYEDVSIPSWEITKSFFSYVKEKFRTTFGIFKSKTGSITMPELYFNVVIRRSFIGPFIGIILPIIVTLVMVFILLITCSNNEEKTDKLGFSAGAILASTAALFFVIIVEQNELRSTLASNSIIYMDFYYFVTYLEFMVVNVDSVMLCFPEKFKWIAWKDNILVKSTFWPLVTTIIFLATIIYFFPQKM